MKSVRGFLVFLSLFLVITTQESSQASSMEVGVTFPQAVYIGGNVGNSVAIVSIPNTGLGALYLSFFPSERVAVSPSVLLSGIFIDDREFIYSTVGCKINVFFNEYSISGGYVPFSVNAFGIGESHDFNLDVSLGIGLGYRWVVSPFIFHLEGDVSLFSVEQGITPLDVENVAYGVDISFGLGYQFRLP